LYQFTKREMKLTVIMSWDITAITLIKKVLEHLYLYLFSAQNIHERDTEHCQHSVHTDNNKYIQFKVQNIIIKTVRLHNKGLKYVVTDKVYKLNPP
jgi:hypothetical protein